MRCHPTNTATASVSLHASSKCDVLSDVVRVILSAVPMHTICLQFPRTRSNSFSDPRCLFALDSDLGISHWSRTIARLASGDGGLLHISTTVSPERGRANPARTDHHELQGPSAARSAQMFVILKGTHSRRFHALWLVAGRSHHDRQMAEYSAHKQVANALLLRDILEHFYPHQVKHRHHYILF